MTVRGFNEYTRHDYVRHVRSFAALFSRSPDTATAEDLRLFQLHQTRIGAIGARGGRSCARRNLFAPILDEVLTSRAESSTGT
jgi:integrase/recombinase XerD